MNMKHFLMCFLLAAFAAGCQTADERPPADAVGVEARLVQCAPSQTVSADADKSRQVDELMSAYAAENAPGAAVLIIQDGKILHQKGYGLARIRDDSKDATPICSDTVFDLASVSKHFTAVAIMILHERGKLNYDDSIHQHLSKSYTLPAWTKTVSIRSLLTHTAGLPDYQELFFDKKEQPVKIEKHWPRSAAARLGSEVEPSPQQTLGLLLKKQPHTIAGWEYSNTGYMTLAQIVEQVSGESFPDFMKNNVFRPLGMNSTVVFAKTRDGQDLPIPNRAVSYDRGWSEFHDIDYTPLNYIYGDGNVNTTLEDMYRWDQALEAILNPGQHPDVPKLLKPETLEAALTRQVATTNPNVGYGFGWFVGEARASKVVWHSGGWVGFRSVLLRFPEQHFSVVVLSNNLHLPPSVLACKISLLYLEGGRLPHFPTPSVTEEELRRAVEKYHAEKDTLLSFSDDITLEDGSLWVKTSNLEKYRLTPAGDNVFYIQGLEGFDLFRYDIRDEKLLPPPVARDIIMQQRPTVR